MAEASTANRQVEDAILPGQLDCWQQPVPSWYRILRVTGVVVLATLLLLGTMSAERKDGSDGAYALGFYAVILGVAVWRARHWAAYTHKPVYRTHLVRTTLRRRLETGGPLVVIGVVLHFTAWTIQHSANSSGQAWPWLVPTPITLTGLVMLFRFRWERVLTTGAVKLKAENEAAMLRTTQAGERKIGEALGRLLARPVVRYPLAAVCFYGAYVAVDMQPQHGGWAAALALTGVAMAWEVSKFILGTALVVGVLYLGFHMVAALPVSVAIIIGALIIASSKK